MKKRMVLFVVLAMMMMAMFAAPVLACNCGCDCQDGHTPGFWGNKHGQAIIMDPDQNISDGISRLDSLDMHPLAGPNGLLPPNYFNPDDSDYGHFDIFKAWLRGGNATNMAYMLSVQYIAMDLNWENGFVCETSKIIDPESPDGWIYVEDLLEAAEAALLADDYTPVGDPNRAYQEYLKNLLDDANNNANWFED